MGSSLRSIVIKIEHMHKRQRISSIFLFMMLGI